MKTLRLGVAVALVFVSGCDCSGSPDTDGGGIDAAGLDGGPGVPDGGDAGRPADSGPPIDAPIGLDAGPCDPSSCMGIGCGCSLGSDCCSNNCDGMCVPAGCMPQGSTCSTNEDCCTLFCDAGTCAPMPVLCGMVGASCNESGDCCTGNCANVAGMPCTTETNCVCGASTGCRAGGEMWDPLESTCRHASLSIL